MSPSTSVIIPTRNRLPALRACLAALAAQDLPAHQFEVIVVDDGSSLHIPPPEEFHPAPASLRIIHQPNAGPGNARNTGAVAARGRFLAFTDDDCLPAPRWLPKLLQTLSAHPDALAGGSTSNGLPQYLGSSVSQLIIDLVYDHFNADPRNARFFASNNMACSRDSYFAMGGFDPLFRAASEDRDLCDRWLRSGRPMLACPAATIIHRHPQNMAAFTRLHFRYGRGAAAFHGFRAARGGSMAADTAFHRRLPALALARLRREPPLRAVSMTLALAWWELVNAAGFLWEKCQNR
ncbi:MAG: glycosyltransferase [Verrucomicrobiota bacterium]|jgi:glycosyltransferase involved in cell wall biosynthesis